MWYTGLGGIIGCVVANLATLVFGCTKTEDINPELISPVIRKYLPKVQKETIVIRDLKDSKESEPLYNNDYDKETKIVRKQSLDEVE